MPIRIRENEDLRKFLGEKLRRLDTGVFKISADSKDIDFHDFAEKLRGSEKVSLRIWKIFRMVL